MKRPNSESKGVGAPSAKEGFSVIGRHQSRMEPRGSIVTHLSDLSEAVEGEDASDESFEAYMVRRHLLIYERYHVKVQAATNHAYTITLTLGSMDGLATEQSWACTVTYSELHKVHKELYKMYPTIREFEFPGKAMFHTKRVVAAREKSFYVFTRLILRIYPTPKVVTEMLSLNPEKNLKLAEMLQTFPKPRIAQCMRFLKGDYEEGEFEDLDGDGVVGTIEDEKIVLEMRKQKAKLQKTEDVVTIVGLIFGGLMFSMLCQSIRRSGGIMPFWYSIPARFYAFYEASMLYLNCLCWVALVCIPFHRALGWIVGTYLTYLLGNEFGPFHMEVDWIAPRFGLDDSSIVIAGFRWRNPSAFTKTPFFVEVKRLEVCFNIFSLFKAFRSGNPLPVQHVVIEGVTAFIEKISDKEAAFSGSNELNLWACLGAGPGNLEGLAMRSDMLKMMTAALKHSSNMTANMARSLLVDPLSMVTGSMTRLFSSGTRSPDNNKRKSSGYSGYDSDSEDDWQDNNDADGESSMNDVEKEEAKDIDTSDGVSGGDTANLNEEEEEFHWGVPYLLNVRRVTVRDIKAYAADFLQANAERVADAHQKKALIIKLIEMKKSETRNTSLFRDTKGLYLDELGWRLISKIIGKLLSTNAGALTLLAGSAAISQGVAAVANTTGTARAKIVEGFYNFNPFRTSRNLSNAVLGKAPQASDVSQSVAMKAMRLKTIHIELLAINKAKRLNGKPIKLAQVEMTLTNQTPEETQKSMTRRANSHYLIHFGEDFALGPVQDFTSVVKFRVLRQSVTGEGSGKCYCHCEIDLRDRVTVGIREWMDVEITLEPGDPETGLHENDDWNGEGSLILKCTLA